MATQTDLTSAGSGAATPAGADPKRWFALAVVVLAAFMDLLDNTIVNVALPSIQKNLGAGYSALQWVTTGYVLSFALLLILGGRLGDIVGRKIMFLIGVAGFTASSLLCALSVTPGMLIGSRVTQGVFAGLMVPQVLSVIHVSFSDEEKPKAYGLFGGVAGLAGAFGIALSGILVNWNLWGLHWRLVFLINVPVGIFALIAGARVIRESKAPWQTKLDVPGLLLSTLGLLLLVFPLIQGREMGWPTWGYVSMGVSVPVLIAFVLYEKRRMARNQSPLVVLSLFKRASFTAGMGTYLAFMIGNGVFFISWAVYLQLGLGYSAIHAGLTSLPFSLAAFFAAFPALMASQKFGRVVLQIGALVALAGLITYGWVVVHYGATASTWIMIAPLIVFGLGFGMLMAPTAPLAIAQAPMEDVGSASGLINTTQQLGYALGAALTAVVFFGLLGTNTAHNADNAAPALKAQLTSSAQVSPQQAAAIATASKQCSVDRVNEKDPEITPASCNTLASLTSNPAAASAVAKSSAVSGATAFAKSFQVALWTFAGLSLAAFFLLFAVPKPRKEENAQAPAAEQATV
jgi:EmrB/QacA subfamily drug resistance transporter